MKLIQVSHVGKTGWALQSHGGDCGLHDCMRTKKVGDCMQAMAMYDDVPVIWEVGWLHVNATMGARLVMYGIPVTCEVRWLTLL